MPTTHPTLLATPFVHNKIICPMLCPGGMELLHRLGTKLATVSLTVVDFFRLQFNLCK